VRFEVTYTVDVDQWEWAREYGCVSEQQAVAQIEEDLRSWSVELFDALKWVGLATSDYETVKVVQVKC
jgi:hypothetical protein